MREHPFSDQPAHLLLSPVFILMVASSENKELQEQQNLM